MKVRARSKATIRTGAVTAFSVSSILRSIDCLRSLLQRVVDDLLDRGVDMLPPRGRILHHHEEHVLGTVDHNIAPGGAIPLELAEGTRRDRCIEAGTDADAETIAEAKAIAGVIVDIARDARARTNVVGGHGFEHRGA